MIRQLILLVIYILVAALVIAAIWTQVAPKYQAAAEVRVRPIIPYLVFQTEDSGMIPLYSSYVNTQVSIIRGSTVLQRALDQREVQETEWYNEPPKTLVRRLLGDPPSSRIERLKDGLSVKTRKETEIIDIAFISTNTKDAKIILDAILDEYVKYIGEKSDATRDEIYSQLVDQYKSLDNEIKGQEVITAALSKSLGTIKPQELIYSQRIRLDETQARLNELKQNIAVLEWEHKELEDLVKQTITDDSNEMLDSTQKQPKYYEDADWRLLDRNVRTIQYGIATSELEPNNPEIILATKDMKLAKELLRLREEQLDEQWRDQLKNNGMQATTAIGPDYEQELKSLNHQLARTKFEEQLLFAKLKKQRKEFEELFDNAQLLEKENKQLQHKHELFDAVRQRLEQKAMESNVPGSIEVLTRAFVPSGPYKDRRILFTAIVLVLSLGLTFSSWLLKRKRMI